MRLMRKRERLAILLFGVFASLQARDYGPPVGAHMPDFTLQDQNGKTQSLKTLLGPKGAMILFFRSADW
jgi:hypothetical protein